VTPGSHTRATKFRQNIFKTLIHFHFKSWAEKNNTNIHDADEVHCLTCSERLYTVQLSSYREPSFLHTLWLDKHVLNLKNYTAKLYLLVGEKSSSFHPFLYFVLNQENLIQIQKVKSKFLCMANLPCSVLNIRCTNMVYKPVKPGGQKEISSILADQ
jgi:hypothetical protein